MLCAQAEVLCAQAEVLRAEAEVLCTEADVLRKEDLLLPSAPLGSSFLQHWLRREEELLRTQALLQRSQAVLLPEEKFLWQLPQELVLLETRRPAVANLLLQQVLVGLQQLRRRWLQQLWWR